MYTYKFDFFLSSFEHLSLPTRTLSHIAKYADTGRPSGTYGRGLGSIRARKLAWCALKVFYRLGVDKAISRGGGVSTCILVRFFFLRRDHDPDTSTAAAAAAAAVHKARYNQLATTLQRYRTQQQQSTPCECDRSALYCVELYWKAREIRHPSHLLVPIISRLLFLFFFERHKT